MPGVENLNLVMVGINHLTAPVALREKTALSSSDLPGVLAQLRALGLEEVVVLATCSRMEIYAGGRNPTASGVLLRDWFLARGGEALAGFLMEKSGPDALRHLFRVASGLDSWIIGESEILGQVKRAYQAALEAKATGRLLNQVFQKALAAGKHVRSRTGIQNGIHSIGGAAAQLARKIFSGRDPGGVVVFGSGEAAESVVRHLAAKNFPKIWVASRSLERAAAVAGPLGAEPLLVADGLAKIAEAEVAVFSTACEHPLLERQALAKLIGGRQRPLFIVDLGLPRNVDSDCAEVPGAYLYDLDDLKRIVRESMDSKAPEKERAEALCVLAAADCLSELEKSEAAARGFYQTQGFRLEPINEGGIAR